MPNEQTTKPIDTSLADAILLLAEQIGASQSQMAGTIAALQQNQVPRDVNFSDQDYQDRLRGQTRVLLRPAYQNGFEVNPSGLSDVTILRLSQLVPGQYLGGLITVAVDGNKAIHLIYKNRTPDQRMIFQQRVQSFSHMVEQIWSEMHPAPATMSVA